MRCPRERAPAARIACPLLVLVFSGALFFQAGCRPRLERTAEALPDDLKAAGVAAAAPKLSFNEHVQPILSENCYACHGADAGSRKGELRLDRAEYAFA
ncbi:MAG TPA: c-type cytochrome domain-containing protein, partial [Opitutus sp.]|nr:c-type cytochrome domain-containing protein [Opitutus sp.]